MDKFKDAEIDFNGCTEECPGYSKKLRKCIISCPAIEGYWKMRELASKAQQAEAKMRTQRDTLISGIKKIIPLGQIQVLSEFISSIKEDG